MPEPVRVVIDSRTFGGRKTFATKAVEAILEHLGVDLEFEIRQRARGDVLPEVVIEPLADIPRRTDCILDWCDKPRRDGDYCNMHYLRKRKGAPMEALPHGVISEEKKAMVARMVAEEASLNEIERSTGVTRKHIRKLHPDYNGWGKGHSERAAEASRVVRQLNKIGSYL